MGTSNEKNSEIYSRIKQHWDELISKGEILCYQPDQYIFYEDHQALGAYLLCKGSIAFTKSNEDSFKKTLSADSQPIIGMDYLLNGDPYEYSAQAITSAEICYLPKSEVLKLLSRSGV